MNVKRNIFFLAFLFIMASFFMNSSINANDFRGQIIDLTCSYDNRDIYWPSSIQSESSKVIWEKSDGDYSWSSFKGTSVDSPLHFLSGGESVEQVSFKEWIGPAFKIDVTNKCRNDQNYMLSVGDIKEWEKQFGEIQQKSWVIMQTGVNEGECLDKENLSKSSKRNKNPLPCMSFPGFSPDAVKFLVEGRNITGVGIDAPITEYEKSNGDNIHSLLYGTNKVAVENLAGLDKLPPKGATLYVIPTMITEETGSPAKVYALVK